MDAPSREFVSAGSLEELKAKGRLVLHGTSPPHKQAGHMTAPDQCCSNSESSCQGGIADPSPGLVTLLGAT